MTSQVSLRCSTSAQSMTVSGSAPAAVIWVAPLTVMPAPARRHEEVHECVWQITRRCNPDQKSNAEPGVSSASRGRLLQRSCSGHIDVGGGS